MLDQLSQKRMTQKEKKSVVACPVGIMLARFRLWGSGALGASFGWISPAQRVRQSANRSSSSKTLPPPPAPHPLPPPLPPTPSSSSTPETISPG